MTYSTLKVNNKEPQSGNIDLQFEDFIQGTPQDGDILKKTSAGFEAFPAPAGGGEVQLMTAQYVDHTTDGLSGTYNFPYSTTYWAYSWPRSIVQNYTYSGATYINVSRPPSYLFPHNPWSCGVTLSPGTYLITCIPSNRNTAITWRLAHLPVDASSGGVFFGNKAYINPADGKTGNMMIGYLTIETSRDIYPAVFSGSASYDNGNTFPSFYFNIRKLA